MCHQNTKNVLPKYFNNIIDALNLLMSKSTYFSQHAQITEVHFLRHTKKNVILLVTLYLVLSHFPQSSNELRQKPLLDLILKLTLVNFLIQFYPITQLMTPLISPGKHISHILKATL